MNGFKCIACMMTFFFSDGKNLGKKNLSFIILECKKISFIFCQFCIFFNKFLLKTIYNFFKKYYLGKFFHTIKKQIKNNNHNSKFKIKIKINCCNIKINIHH